MNTFKSQLNQISSGLSRPQNVNPTTIKKLGVLQSRVYLKAVYTFISDKWKLPAELARKLETRVRLIIAKDGTLLEYSFVKVSGNKIFDQSVKSLLADLETLPALPKDFDGKVTEIGLKFKPL